MACAIRWLRGTDHKWRHPSWSGEARQRLEGSKVITMIYCFFSLFFWPLKSDYSESPVNSPTPGRRNHPLIKTVNPDPSKPVFVQSPQSVRRELKIGEPIKITIPSNESSTKNGHPTLQRASTNQSSPLRLGVESWDLNNLKKILKREISTLYQPDPAGTNHSSEDFEQGGRQPLEIESKSKWKWKATRVQCYSEWSLWTRSCPAKPDSSGRSPKLTTKMLIQSH